MKYNYQIAEGTLVRRYKRFLTDVIIAEELITAFCPNTGSMSGLTQAGNWVRISGPYEGRGRKYLYTLEQIEITRTGGRKVWVGVNTQIPNSVTAEAAGKGLLPGLEEYRQVRKEVKIAEGSRIDLLLTNDRNKKCWVEVKNVTLVLPDAGIKARFNEGSVAAFPDAVTTRGAKHLRELVKKVEVGDLAAMVYCIQREDAESFSPAEGFDPVYALELRKAAAAGVKVMPVVCQVRSEGVEWGRVLDYRL